MHGYAKKLSNSIGYKVLDDYRFVKKNLFCIKQLFILLFYNRTIKIILFLSMNLSVLM